MSTNTSRRSAPQKWVQEGIQAVPTSPTNVTTTDTILWQICVGNPTGAGITFSVSDRQSPAMNPINETVAANSFQIMTFEEGFKFLNGLTWVAGGVGLVAEIVCTFVT